MHHHLITAFMFKFIAEVALAVTNAVVLNEIGTPIVVKREAMPISSNNQNNHKFLEHKMPLTMDATELRTKEEYKKEAEPVKVDGFEWHFYAEKIAKEFLTLKLMAYPPDNFYGTYEIEIKYRISMVDASHATVPNLDVEEKLGKITCGTDKLPRSSVFQQLVIDELLNPKKGFLPNGTIEIVVQFTITYSTMHNLTEMALHNENENAHKEMEHVWSGISRNATNKSGNGTIPAGNASQSVNKTPIEPTRVLGMPKDVITRSDDNSSINGGHNLSSGKKKEESPSSSGVTSNGLKNSIAEEVGLINSGRAIRKHISFTIEKAELEKDKFSAESAPIRVLGLDWSAQAKKTEFKIPPVLDDKLQKVYFLTLVLDAKPPNGNEGQSYSIHAYARFSILNGNGKPEKNLARTIMGHILHGPRETSYGVENEHKSELVFWKLAEVKDLLDPVNGLLSYAKNGLVELQVDFTIISSTLDHLSVPQLGDANANALTQQGAASPEYEHHILLAIDKCKELFKREYFARSASALKPLKDFNWSLEATTETEHKGFLCLRLHARPPKDLKTADYRILVDYRITILSAADGHDLVYEKRGEEYVGNKYTGPEHPYTAEFNILLNAANGFVRYDDFIEVAVDFTIKPFKVSPILPTNEVAPIQQNAILKNVDLTNNGAYDEHIRLGMDGNKLQTIDYYGERSKTIYSLGFTWFLKALNTNGFLTLELEVQPPTPFIDNYHMEARYCITLLNKLGKKNLVKEGKGEIGFTKEQAGSRHAYIKLDSDFRFPNVAKMEDLLNPSKGFLHDGSIVAGADFSITYSLLLVIEDCERLFRDPTFSRSSWQLGYPLMSTQEPISRLKGTFSWQLEAKGENGWLSVFLHAKPPANYKGKYGFEIDYRISLLNVNNDKHRSNEKLGQVCTEKHNTGWGNPKMATFEELLDKSKGFLRPNGSIEVLAKFSIKSFEMEPIP